MKNSRWSIVVALIALTLTGANLATAQVVVKAEDPIGTWELVSTKDWKTGTANYGIYDTSTAIQWMQFTRSHWMFIAMVRDRSKMSSGDTVKDNYAKVWNEKNEQIFGAICGTYSLNGDKLHIPAMLALSPSVIGVDRVLKIVRLDKSTMAARMEYPDTPTRTWELTFRRID